MPDERWKKNDLILEKLASRSEDALEADTADSEPCALPETEKTAEALNLFLGRLTRKAGRYFCVGIGITTAPTPSCRIWG